MPIADGVLKGLDGVALSRGDRVAAEIATGRPVAGKIESILKGDIVVVWNENETPVRKRSGKHYKFEQAH